VTDLLVLWDVDGTLVDAGGVGRDLFEQVFLELFGRPAGVLAPMAGRTDRAIIRETLELAGIPEPRRHVDPFIARLAARTRRSPTSRTPACSCGRSWGNPFARIPQAGQADRRQADRRADRTARGRPASRA
jgi:hypothetical protein